jgi:hypothetical protein
MENTIYEAIKKTYRKYVPISVRTAIEKVRNRRYDTNLIKEINQYFAHHPDEKTLFLRELEFLNKEKSIRMIPYSYVLESDVSNIDVYFDMKYGFPYVIHRGKKLYFPADISQEGIRKMYRHLLLEQHPSSPHRYFSETLSPGRADTFMDIGASEGLISLELADIVHSLILFEPDTVWHKPLSLTFKPWEGKVRIVPKSVSNLENDQKTTVDSFLSSDNGPILMKIDVEGDEALVLQGAEKVLKKPDTRIVCCTYHRKEDSARFDRLFSEKGFKTEFTNGYLLPTLKWMQQPPYFRKGLIRAWK